MKINPPGCRSNCGIRRPNMEYSPANYSLASVDLQNDKRIIVMLLLL